LFINRKRITDEIKCHLPSGTEVHDYDDIIAFLEQHCASAKTWLSSGSSHAIVSAIYKVKR